jgi:uncharacterized protein YbjQ (UPF0145 family)
MQQQKFGVEERADGLTYCKGCGLPTSDSVLRARLAGQGVPVASVVALLTIPNVPGRDIAAVLGLVEGVGHPTYQGVTTTTTTRGQRALDEAQDDLLRNARMLKADAVVGIVLSSYSGGNRAVQSAMGVHLLGTAVTLRPIDPPSPVA